MNRIQSDRYPFHSTAKEYFKDWLENKKENYEVANKVKSKSLNTIKELEIKLESYKDIAEEATKVKELFKKNKLSTYDIFYTVEDLIKKTKTSKIKKEARENINNCIDTLKELL